MSDWNFNRKPSLETPYWISEVVDALRANDIPFTIIDPILGIFNCQNKVGGRGYRYYASGGVILGSNLKGLRNLIGLLSMREEPVPFPERRNQWAPEPSRRNNILPFFKEIRNGRPVDNYYPQRNMAYAAG